MTQSQQLSSDLSEVELYRPNKRPRRSSSSSSSSSTSSTSSKTLQPERWAFVDEASYPFASCIATHNADNCQVPHSAQFDRQPEQITVAAPSPLLSVSPKLASISTSTKYFLTYLTVSSPPFFPVPSSLLFLQFLVPQHTFRRLYWKFKRSCTSSSRGGIQRQALQSRPGITTRAERGFLYSPRVQWRRKLRRVRRRVEAEDQRDQEHVSVY